MAKGLKTGGRSPGTPNKRTQEVSERLQPMECDPIEGMARIALDKSVPLDLRARMFAELAPYVYPKRKLVERALDQQVAVQICIERPSAPDDEQPALGEAPVLPQSCSS